MPKSDNFTFADIKRATDSSLPVPPSTDRSRTEMLVAGNPDVIAEARDHEPTISLKSGPAWEESLRNCTPVQHSPGKKDLNELARRKPITY
jgi:hypothetical protein